MKSFYLFLTIAGAILPYSHFIPFLRSHGLDVNLFVSELFANNISSFFATDFLICCLTFWVFSYHEARKHQMKHWWLYIVATLTIGLSFAFPLFLYFRRKAFERT
ncbi:DUF2834 domain-containing protein [Brevibacillus choshinensis]|uniref:DUF2834 domain-containing protein n=1 Tax=Brevibacillus choshinensis TaxID=54911 RepID=A0ABX7FQD6_BRECH|nr:DUF2834 domain-containing protein [Brevibacillus choshinensis]QRG68464.1 DUF2834 domain-containing protein [Brevibacillus choshinensis]